MQSYHAVLYAAEGIHKRNILYIPTFNESIDSRGYVVFGIKNPCATIHFLKLSASSY